MTISLIQIFPFLRNFDSLPLNPSAFSQNQTLNYLFLSVASESTSAILLLQILNYVHRNRYRRHSGGARSRCLLSFFVSPSRLQETSVRFESQRACQPLRLAMLRLFGLHQPTTQVVRSTPDICRRATRTPNKKRNSH